MAWDDDKDIEHTLNLGMYAAAVAMIIDRYSPKLYRKYARSSMGEVEDLLQDVFLSVAKDIKSFKRTVPIGFWVGAIAKNRFADHYRKKHAGHGDVQLDDASSAQLVPHALGAIAVADPWPGVDEDLEYDAQSAALCDAIKWLVERGKLSLDELRLVEYRYVDEFSYAQIAQLCDKSEAALQMSVSRAMIKIVAQINAQKKEI